jgi:putative glycosyltransferase (TIGR04372 family)
MLLVKFFLDRLLFYRIIFNFSYLFKLIIIIFLKNQKNKSLKVRDNLIINKNLGLSHSNNTNQGIIISFLTLINDFDEILEKNLFGNFLQKTNFNKKNYSDIRILFYFYLRTLSKDYPETSFVFFLITMGKFNLLKEVSFNEFSKNNDDYCLANKIKDIYLIKYLESSEITKKKISNILNNLLLFSKNFLIILITKYSVEQKFSNYKIFKKLEKKLNFCDKRSYLEKYKNNILGSNLYAFGHLINFIDIYHRYTKLNLGFKKKIVISPYFVANSCLANYLRLKYANLCIINHNLFIYFLKNKKILNNDLINFEEINRKNSIYNLSYSEFKKTGFVSPSICDRTYSKLINKLKIKNLNFNEPYVCLILRNSTFKSYDHQLESNDDRYSNPFYVYDLIKIINKKGYKVILLNGSLNYEIKKNLDLNYFDYSNSKFRNDYNDINLVKNCNFIVRFGTSSSLHSLLFNKYIFNINYPLNRKPIFHNLAYYLPKKIIKFAKKFSNLNYFNDHLFINHDYNVIKSLGYKLIDNDFETVKDSFNFFYEAYLKKIKYSNLITIKSKNKFNYPLNLINI